MDLWSARRDCLNMALAQARTFPVCAGRNEPLSGGGTSSGLMGWLKIGERGGRRHKIRRNNSARPKW